MSNTQTNVQVYTAQTAGVSAGALRSYVSLYGCVYLLALI